MPLSSMKLLFLLALSGGVTAPGLLAQAQAKPDFSGVWVAVSPDTAGFEETIRQDGQTLTLIHAAEGEDHQQVYRLDGTETRNTTASHGQEIVSIARARWDGVRLVITESVRYPDGRTVEGRKTFSLDENGFLTVELQDTLNGKALPLVRVQYKRKAA